MKALLAGFSALGLMLVVTSAGYADPPKDPGAQGQNKVTICHFPGHGGVKGRDLLIGKDKGGTTEKDCDVQGGQAITVSIAGAENGHGVTIKGEGPHK